MHELVLVASVSGTCMSDVNPHVAFVVIILIIPISELSADSPGAHGGANLLQAFYHQVQALGEETIATTTLLPSGPRLVFLVQVLDVHE